MRIKKASLEILSTLSAAKRHRTRFLLTYPVRTVSDSTDFKKQLKTYLFKSTFDIQ